MKLVPAANASAVHHLSTLLFLKKRTASLLPKYNTPLTVIHNFLECQNLSNLETLKKFSWLANYHSGSHFQTLVLYPTHKANAVKTYSHAFSFAAVHGRLVKPAKVKVL